MNTRARSILAVVVTAAVGIAAGVTTAFVVPGNADGPSAPSATDDPLRLGVNLVNVACTGDALLIVAHGDSSAPLSVGVGENRDDGVRYLRVSDSCPTIYASVDDDPDEPIPKYAAYLGPYDLPAEPCATRMTPAHRGDTVTVLRSGNDQFVKCACVLPTSAAPDLVPGMAPDSETSLWVRQLQSMLVDFPDELMVDDDITGVYDTRTQDRIRMVQLAAASGTIPGTVDAETWNLVKHRACELYDY